MEAKKTKRSKKGGTRGLLSFLLHLSIPAKEADLKNIS
jgi:hypothetical protein